MDLIFSGPPGVGANRRVGVGTDEGRGCTLLDGHWRQRFIDGLSEPAAQRLRDLGTPVGYGRGEVLLHAGDAGEFVVWLTAGRVKVTGTTRGGTEVILDFGYPGDVYGEMAVLTGDPRIATVVALEPVAARRISAADFLEYLTSFPDAHREALVAVTRRLSDANARRVSARSGDATVALARRLVELVEACGEPAPSGWRIDLPLTHRELAQFVPTSKSSTDQALTRLREMGAVTTSYHDIIVTDLERLRRVIDDQSTE